MKKRIVLFALNYCENVQPALKKSALRGLSFVLAAIFLSASAVYPAFVSADSGDEKKIEKRENKSKKQSKESVKKTGGVKNKKNKAPVDNKVKKEVEKSKDSKSKDSKSKDSKSKDSKSKDSKSKDSKSKDSKSKDSKSKDSKSKDSIKKAGKSKESTKIANKKKPVDNKKKKSDEKKELPLKDVNYKTLDMATDEILINSKKYKVGGISLEKKIPVKKSKINEIKKLAADVKKDFEEHKKVSRRKKNRYSIELPDSYHNIDTKLAFEIMRRVNLSSLAMFKTLYLPHLKKARSVKNRTALKERAGGDALDERTKMALFIVGSFINEVIEKYNSGNLSKTYKDFGRWVNEGANILAYGTIFPGDSGARKSTKKSGGRNGVISFETAKKLLRALIEVESSAVQMKHGRANISLNMRTYPRDGSYVIGFMQESVDDFARGVNLFDPEINIKYTCKKLHKYLVKYNGNYDKMLRHYNAGQGNMDCEQAHRYSAKVHKFMERY